MNCIIYKILLLGKENNEKREVEFKGGVNIISGQSRSGKSALLRIFDYCLCSKTNKIPSGEIDDFTDVFCLILKHNNSYIILGRKKFNNTGASKMYFKLETDKVKVDKIDKSYFHNEEQSVSSVKKHLGLILGLAENSEQESNKSHTPSIRNMMTFFLQYQNLLSSEHALFSRFEDFYSKKDTIDQFPIFAGWIDDKYFLFKREKETISDELNKLERLRTKELEVLKNQKEEIKEHCKSYFSIVGKRFDDSCSLDDVIRISKNLPDFNSNSIISEDLRIRYLNLKENRHALKTKLNLISNRVTSIEFNSKYANEYNFELNIAKEKSNTGLLNDNCICPLCNQKTLIISNEIKKINVAKKDLENELRSLKFHSKDFTIDLGKLKDERELYKKEISTLNSKIKYIEDQFNEIGKYKSSHDKAIYAKAQLEIKLDNILNKDIINSINKDILNKREQLKELENELLGLDFSAKREYANKWINEKISKICSELDFEERYTNPKCQISFDFETFSLYIKDNINNEVISFGQLGSASNYLTCHLGLFISILGLFWKAENSKVPNILFLDQPSQVYFPAEPKSKIKQEDEEYLKVKNIYNTIIRNIDEISLERKDKKEKGQSPQVIILDHAKDLNLEEFEYANYLRKSWWNEEDGKLI